MYAPHPLQRQPEPHAALWRYMDLAKFLSLLVTKRLHLANLSSFSDPFEGHPPKSLVDAYTTITEEMPAWQREERLALFNKNLQFFQQGRELIFASCWHMNDHESEGMWAQYLRGNQGIAIKTTFERLRQAAVDQPISLSGALVDYVDFNTHESRDINLFTWAALKRQSFVHESEFRLLALRNYAKEGMYIEVDPCKLIEHVYVAPTTPDWLTDTIQRVLDKYSCAKPIIQSKLTEPPKYYPAPV